MRASKLASMALFVVAVTAIHWPIHEATATAPNLICSYYLTHPDNRDATIGNTLATGAPTFFTEGVQVQDGSIAWSTRVPQQSPSLSIDTTMYRLTSTCGLAWAKTTTCAATTSGVSAYCLRSGPIADDSNQYSSLLLNVLGSSVVTDTLVRTSANSGNTLNPTVPYNTAPNNPPPVSVTGPGNPTGGAAYIASSLVFSLYADPAEGGSGAIRAYSDSAFQWAASPTGKAVYTLTANPTNGFVTGWTTAGSDFKKLVLSSHTYTGGNLAGSDGNWQLVDRTPPRVGQGALNGKVWTIHGLTNSATLVYDEIDVTAWTKTIANQALTGFSTNFDARGFDVDGANNLAICGKDKTAGANNLGYVAFGDTTANTFTSILSIPQPATFAGGTAFQTEACRFDTQGGLWTISSGTCLQSTFGTCYVIQRWSVAGAFTNPTAPALQNLYTNPDCFSTGCSTATVSVTAGVDADQGIKGFGASVGFTSPSGQFLFGLILALLVFLIVSGGYASLTKHYRGAAWAGAGACFGIMLFNVLTGIWSIWVTIVMVVLNSVIIMVLVRLGIFAGAAATDLQGIAGELRGEGFQ